MIESEERGKKDNGIVEKTKQGLVGKGRVNEITDAGTTSLHLMCSSNINPAKFYVLLTVDHVLILGK